MYAASTISEDSTRPEHASFRELLNDQLEDLLKIHWENKFGPSSGSLYLKGCHYVSGEKLGERSYMRFRLLVGVGPEQAKNDAAIIVTLNADWGR